MLCITDCRENKTLNFLSKNSTAKVAETLQSEISQVAVTFSGLQRTRNSSIRKHHERHIGILSNSQKHLSLLHAQVDDRCPDSSHSPLKRNCSTKRIESYDNVFVFKEFYPAVVGSLDQLSESRNGEVLERSYLKAITTARFLVSLEIINATLKLTKTFAKKLKGIKKSY